MRTLPEQNGLVNKVEFLGLGSPTVFSHERVGSRDKTSYTHTKLHNNYALLNHIIDHFCWVT